MFFGVTFRHCVTGVAIECDWIRAPPDKYFQNQKTLNPRPRSGRAQREISQVAGSSDKTGSSVERPSGNFSIHHPEAGLRTAIRRIAGRCPADFR